MPDFGDEVGQEMSRTAQSMLQTWIMRRGYKQGQSVERDGQEVFQWPCESVGEMDAVYKAARQYGIQCHKDIAPDGSASLMVKAEDLPRAERIMENLRQDIKDKQAARAAKQDAKAVPARTAQPRNTHEADTDRTDDYIKSHDSGDPNARTTHDETPGGEESWKAGINQKVEEARRGAVDVNDFINRCQERGVDVGYAKDGELLFMVPGKSWLSVRGDTLGEKFTLGSFTEEKSEYASVEEQARYTREVSRERSQAASIGEQGREMPQFQQLSK